ncbi:MAG TPA: ABC transporter permease [Flavobacterium sp.]|nr:ABC transporter permease [Flavobacterium sp.]
MDLFYRKLKISKPEFLFQFQSHPNYPSSLAFSDTLSFLGIKNEAYEIEKEFWHELPKQFITVYNNNFSFVEKLNNEYLVFTDKKQKVSQEDLFNNSGDIVFIFEETESVNNKNNLNYKYFGIFLIAFALVLSFFTSDFSLFFFNLLSTIGLIISLELFKNKFGEKSSIIDNFCSNDNNFDVENSCNKIFKSDKINVLGLKLSDFSLVYFLSFLTLGLLFPESAIILKYISFLSIFVIFYSLYIQLFKEKSTCKICLLIITTLIGQIILSSLFFVNNINFKSLFIFFFISISLFFLVGYIDDILKQKDKFYLMSLKNSRFKKNYDIFKRELILKPINFKIKNNEFLLGNKSSKLNISIITNPYCGYCKEAYLIVEKIISKYPEISIQLRFNYFRNNSDENLTMIISIFRNIFKNKGSGLLLEAIEFWHNKNNIEIFKNQYKSYINETDMNGIFELAEENRNFGLTQTPQILINNYLFSNLYEREDIFYFIDELLEDEEILNEKV